MKSQEKLTSYSISGICLYAIGSILVRWCVSVGQYSGFNTPPMFGDYEAQRHWQEITTNIPVSQWYTNSSVNNLQYWGLDYPPLTAYHSWLCGYIASKINSEWVSLEESRGIENYQHKLFMRYTVLVADLLVLFPALFLLWKRNNITYTTNNFLLTLFYPGLILIDHGHFQYNNMSLGLMLFSVLAFDIEMLILGSVFFCMALNYKQMELYHALPVFFLLLGKAFSRTWTKCFSLIAQLGITVICCFALLWLPYLFSVDSTLQVLNRLFPVNRGLYEDKVANFWCSIAPVIKLRDVLDRQAVINLCAASTLFLSLPSCIHLFIYPTKRNFRFSLMNVSMIFFLFSYQVHEKSILIPAISACLLYDEVAPILVTWFLQISVLSMSPLLGKDQLTMQLCATSVIFLVLSATQHGLWKASASRFVDSFTFLQPIKSYASNAVVFVFWLSIVTSVTLVILPLIFVPPPQFPDLLPVAISTISCAAFLFFSLIFHYLQFSGTLVVSMKKKTK